MLKAGGIKITQAIFANDVESAYDSFYKKLFPGVVYEVYKFEDWDETTNTPKADATPISTHNFDGVLNTSLDVKDLAPGKYVTVQKTPPTNTLLKDMPNYVISDVVADVVADVKFVNRINQRAVVAIKKTFEGNPVGLSSEFTLYQNGVATSYKAITNTNDGEAFIFAPAGIYTLEETNVPNGYIKLQGLDITLEEGNIYRNYYDTPLVNKKNSADLSIKKYAASSITAPHTPSADAQLLHAVGGDTTAITFKLERKIESDADYTVVNAAIALNTSSAATLTNLERADADGNFYSYRLTENDHSIAGFSKDPYVFEFTYDATSAYEAKFYNIMQSSLRFKKAIKYVDTNGTIATSFPEGKKFDIYKEVNNAGTLSYEQVATGFTSDANGVVTSSALNIKDDTGAIINYYIYEQPADLDGYALAIAAPRKVVTTADGKQLVGPFQLSLRAVTDFSGNAAYYVNNNELLGAIKVNKQSSTNNVTNLAGAKFKVYYMDNGVKTYIKDDLGADAEFETTAAKLIVTINKLPLSTKYFVEETVAPAGYQLNTTPVEVELTDAALNIKTATIKNTLFPTISGTKQVITPYGLAPVTLNNVNEVKFELYRKLDNGTMERVIDDKGLQVTLWTLANGSVPFHRLNDLGSNYYIKEVNVPSSMIAPEHENGLKTGAVTINGVVQDLVEIGGSYYAGPFDFSSGANAVFTFKNYQNNAQLQFRKVNKDGTKPVNGAVFKISTTTTDAYAITRLTANGFVKVGDTYVRTINLGGGSVYTGANNVIYDSTGAALEYTLTETTAPEGYHLPEDGNAITFTLEPDSPYLTTGGMHLFIIKNIHKTSFKMTKYGYDAFYGTGMWGLDGATFAAYRINPEDNTLEFVGTKVSANYGDLIWDNLYEDSKYVFVEVSPPNEFIIPQGYVGLEDPASLDGKPATELDAKPYVKRYHDFNVDSGTNYVYTLPFMESVSNPKPFIQFKLIKTDSNNDTLLLNGAQFQLYSASQADYDAHQSYAALEAAGKLTLEDNGTVYETGTLSPGTFITNPHRFGKVFWLKEIKAPFEYEMLTEPVGPIIPTADDANKTIVLDAPNNRIISPGPGSNKQMFQMKLRKQLLTKDGELQDAKGVTFRLYVGDANFNAVGEIGRFMTGVNAEEPGMAMSQSYLVNQGEFYAQYKDHITLNADNTASFNIVLEEWDYDQSMVPRNGGIYTLRVTTKLYDVDNLKFLNTYFVENPIINDEKVGVSIRVQKTGHAVGNPETWPLAGAEIGIYKNADCTDLETSRTTGKNGQIYVDLDPQTDYWIKEIKAPFGYELNYNVIQFRTGIVGDETVTYNLENIEMRKLKITKTDADGKPITATFKVVNYPTGIQILDGNNEPNTQDIITSGFDDFVYVLGGGVYELVELSVNGVDTTDVEKHYFQLANRANLNFPIKFAANEAEKTVNLINPGKGTLNIQKLDEENNPVPNVKFDVQFQAFGAALTTPATATGWTTPIAPTPAQITVGANGTLTLTDMTPGWYKLTEHTPEGFVAPATDLIVAVYGKHLGSTTGLNSVIVKNVHKAYANFSKTFEPSEFDTVPTTLTLSLYTDAACTIPARPATITINIDPTTHKGTTGDMEIGVGKYYVKEESLAAFVPMYKIGASAESELKGAIELNITTSNNIDNPINLSFRNITRYAKLKVSKTNDTVPQVFLEGASFILYYINDVGAKVYYQKDKTWLANGTQNAQNFDSDVTGLAVLDVQLPQVAQAEYFIQEIVAPDTYAAGPDVKVSLAYGQEATVTVPNTRGIVVDITKYGNKRENITVDNKFPLEGAEFSIYKVDTAGTLTFLQRLTSDAQGHIHFTNLPKLEDGSWYGIEESNIPDGFLNDEMQVFKATSLLTTQEVQGKQLYKVATNENAVLDIYNHPTGSLAILKYNFLKHTEPPQYLTFTLQSIDDPTALPITAMVEAFAANDPSMLPGGFVKGAKYYEGTGSFAGYLFTSDIVSNLKPGKYTVTEKTDAEEYTLNFYQPSTTTNADPWFPTKTVEIKDDGSITSVVFANLPTPEFVDPQLIKEITAVNGDTANTTTVPSLQEAEQTITYKISGFATETNALDMPVLDYTLVDTKLEFTDFNGFPVTNVTSVIKSLTIGKAKYVATATRPTPATTPILASIYGIKADNTETFIRTIPVSEGPQTINFATLGDKYERFKVVYSEANEDILKEGFVADPIEVTMGFQQSEDIDFFPVINIKNTAQVKLSVNITGEVETSNPVDAVVAITALTSEDRPRAKIEKITYRVDRGSGAEELVGPGYNRPNLLPGDLVRYKVTVTNTSEKELSITDPVIFDKIPNLIELDINNTSVDTTNAPDIVAGDPGQNGEYVFIKTTGKLHKGNSITLTLNGMVKYSSVDSGAAQIVNDAYMASLKLDRKNKTNPNGASFRNEAGGIPEHGMDGAIFGETGIYDSIMATSSTAFANENKIGLYKMNAGDVSGLDVFTGSDKSALVSPDGEILYSIVVYNGGQVPIKNIRIIDKLPVPGDTTIGKPTQGRLSNWKVTLEGIVSSTEPNYTFYSTATAEAGANYQNSLTTGATAIWSEGVVADAKAFMLDFGDKELKMGEKISIIVKGKAISYSEALTTNQFYNTANNNATICTDNNPITILTSDIAKVALVPTTVNVGNRVWLDVNGDGKQDGAGIDDPTATHSEPNFDSANYPHNMNITLRTFINSDTAFATKTGAIGTNGFYNFSGIVPAELGIGVAPEQAFDANGNVLKDKLKGVTRTAYQIEITGVPKGFVPSINNAMGGNFENKRTEPADSNFRLVGNALVSERFYVNAGADDFTKDLGLVPVRNLEILKSGTVHNQLVEGAVFNIYGPFDSFDNLALSDANMVGAITTGADGVAKFTSTTGKHMLRCSKYVVVEVNSGASYYSKDNLDVSGADVVQATEFTPTGAVISDKNYFGLTSHTPDNLGDYEIKLSIKNDYVSQGSLVLAAKKELLGKTLEADEFTFTITSPAGTQQHPNFTPITATNTADGNIVFPAIKYTHDDDGKTYKYVVAETGVPATTGMVADTTTKEILVSLADDGKGTMVTTLGETFADLIDGNPIVKVFQNKVLGNITIQKSTTGTGADVDKQFTFNITAPSLGNQSFSTIKAGQAGNLAFTDGKATVNLSNGQAITIIGLLAGTEYTISEAEANQNFYTTTVKHKGVDLVDADNKPTIVVSDTVIGTDVTANGLMSHYTNHKDVGKLTITKTVIGNSGNTTVEFPFNIAFTNDAGSVDGTYPATGKYSSVTITNGAVSNIMLKHGESLVINGLPVGTNYTVTETDTKDHILTKTGDTGAITTTGATAAFTNSRNSGVITIRKTILGNAASTSDVFKFNVTLSYKGQPVSGTFEAEGVNTTVEFINGMASIGLKDGEYITIKDILVDSVYSIEEVDALDYEALTENVVDINMTDAGGEYVFENRRDSFGDLLLAKKLGYIDNGGNQFSMEGKKFKLNLSFTPATVNYTTGNHVFNADGTYDAVRRDAENNVTDEQVTITNNKLSVELMANETLLIKGLYQKLGYTLTEDDYSNLGYTTEIDNGAGIISATQATATATNTRLIGFLFVEKTVKGKGADENKEFKFKVSLKQPDGIDPVTSYPASLRKADGTIVDVTLNVVNETVEFSLKHNERMWINDINVGTAYEVVEDDYTADGYSTESYDETAIINRGSHRVDFFNTRQVGSLNIRKQLEGNASHADKQFEFEITLTNDKFNVNREYPYLAKGGYTPATGTITFVNGKATVLLRGSESIQIDDILFGTKYTVNETTNVHNADGTTSHLFDDLDYIVTNQTEEGTINAETVFEVATINTRNAGNITINKTIKGNGAYEDDEFNFKVTLTKNGAPVNKTSYKYTAIGGYEPTEGELAFENGVGLFTLKGGQSITLLDIVYGVEYTVEELPSTIVGYDVTPVEAFVDTIAQGEHVLDFVNERNIGSLMVTKELAGNSAHSDKQFTMEITLSHAKHPVDRAYPYIATGGYEPTEGTIEFVGGKATVLLRGGESITINDVLNGTAFTVVETDALISTEGKVESLSNFDYISQVIGGEGTISTGNTSSTSVVNERNSGTLEVQKLVAGNKASKDKAFVFYIGVTRPNGQPFNAALNYKGTNIPDGKLYFTNGITSIELKHDQKIIIEDIVYGSKYTVKERDQNQGGYITTITGNADGTISETPASVQFLNFNNEYGSLSLSKFVAGNLGDNGQEFEFEFKFTDWDGTPYDDLMKYTVYSSGAPVEQSVQFVDGIALIKLKGGQSIVTEPISTGIKYEINEISASPYNPVPINNVGVIEQQNKQYTVVFINSANVGSLKIVKTVANSSPQTYNHVFRFDIKLEDEFGKPFEGKLDILGGGTLEFVKGKAFVDLKDGQSITIINIPAGLFYKVTERKVEGYETESFNTSGLIKDGRKFVRFNNIWQNDYSGIGITMHEGDCFN